MGPGTRISSTYYSDRSPGQKESNKIFGKHLIFELECIIHKTNPKYIQDRDSVQDEDLEDGEMRNV